jgi:hypothetical protein
LLYCADVLFQFSPVDWANFLSVNCIGAYALAWVAGLWRAALCSLAIATVAGGIHLTQPDDPTAPVEAVADSDLLEVATLGDLPGFEAPLPDTLRP